MTTETAARRTWFRFTRRRLLIPGLVAVVLMLPLTLLFTGRETPPTLIAELRPPLKSNIYPWPLAFSPDGKTLAATNPIKGISLWDLEKKTVRTELDCGSKIWDARFSPDGTRLAFAEMAIGVQNALPVIKVFDVVGSELLSYRMDRHYIPDMRFSNDGSTFTLITWNNPRQSPPVSGWQFRSWNTATWTPLPDRAVNLPIPFNNISRITPDGNILISGDWTKSGIVFWNLTSEKVIANLVNQSDPGASPTSIDVSNDGRTLALGWSDGALELCDLPQVVFRKSLRGHRQSYVPRRVQFSNDPEVLISEGNSSGPKPFALIASYLLQWVSSRGQSAEIPPEIVVWDLHTGRVRGRLLGEHRAVLSPDGKRLATCNDARTIRVWDVSAK